MITKGLGRPVRLLLNASCFSLSAKALKSRMTETVQPNLFKIGFHNHRIERGPPLLGLRWFQGSYCFAFTFTNEKKNESNKLASQTLTSPVKDQQKENIRVQEEKKVLGGLQKDQHSKLNQKEGDLKSNGSKQIKNSEISNEFQKKFQEQRAQFKRNFINSLATATPWFLLIAILGLGIELKKEWEIASSQKKRKQNLQVCFGSKQVLNIPQYFVEGTSTDVQLEKWLNMDKTSGIFYIAGVPGKGKTTSLQFLLKKMRQDKKKRVFYINLRRSEQKMAGQNKGPEKLIELLNYIEENLINSSKTQCFLIVDDANEIPKWSSLQENLKADPGSPQNIKIKKIYQSLVDLQALGCKVYLISSETVTDEQLKLRQSIQKGFKIQVVQPKSKSELQQAMLSMLYFNYRVNYSKQQLSKDLQLFQKDQNALDPIRAVLIRVTLKAAAHECSLRFLQMLIKGRRLEDLEKQFDSQKESHIVHIDRAINRVFKKFDLRKKNLNSQLKDMINRIINMKQQIHKKDCDSILRMIKDKNLIDQVQEAIEELDTANVLMYCHPRSNFERMALQKYLESLPYPNL